MEIAKPGGIEAKIFLSSYILNKSLKCQYKDISYKRIVAQCFLNGKDIARPLLEKGYAKELKKFTNGYYSKKKVKLF